MTAGYSDFTVECFERLIGDMQDGGPMAAVKRFPILDGVQRGLIADVRRDGHVFFDVMRSENDFVRIGEHPHMTVAEAREAAMTMLATRQ